MKNNLIIIAYAVAWISTGLTIKYGVEVTGSLWCLWAFAFPASIKMRIKL